MGAGGTAAARSGGLRRRPGRARPVLLPPPRRVRRAAGGGGDPRPRERADRRAGTWSPRPTSCRSAPTTPRSSAPGWRGRVDRLVAGGELREAGGRALPRSQRVRRGQGAAALGLGRLGGGGRARLGRDARPGRGRARLHHDPPRRDLPPPRPLLRGRAARHRRPAGGRLALRRRLVHAAEEGDRDLHRAGARAAHDQRRRAALRRGLGHRAGDRLPAGLDLRPGALRHRRPGAARAALRHPGALVRAAGAAQRRAAARRPARLPARHRARPDRGAAADRDVRPLGHRRPLDQRPLPDRPLDDLHLRRPSGRGGNHAARLRAVRASARRRRAADRRVPLRVGLPLLRAEPQVRQPQRTAAQGRGAGADAADAGGACEGRGWASPSRTAGRLRRGPSPAFRARGASCRDRRQWRGAWVGSGTARRGGGEALGGSRCDGRLRGAYRRDGGGLSGRE